MKKMIDKATYEKAKEYLKKMGKIGTAGKKLQAVIASYENDIAEVCKVMNVSRSSLHIWTKQVKESNPTHLINKSKHQDGIKLKKYHKEKIKEWLSKDSNVSIMLIKEKLEKYFGLEVSRATVHRAMQSCGFSYITPRKNHYKQDKIKAKEFKKKSEE